jgi:hypothetical protein
MAGTSNNQISAKHVRRIIMPMARCLKISTAALALSVVLVAADSPFLGHWKLNSDKSKLTDGLTGQSATYHIETDGKGWKFTYEGPTPTGQKVTATYTSSLDGTPVKVSGNASAVVNAVLVNRVDDHTLTVKGTKDGQSVYTDQRVVSEDGKTMTVTRTYTNPQGQESEVRMVYNKQ